MSQNNGKTHCIGDINNNQGTIINGDEVIHNHMEKFNIDYSSGQKLYAFWGKTSYAMPYDGAVIVTAGNANIYVNDKKIATILVSCGQKQSCQILVSKADKVEVKYTSVEKPEVTIYPIRNDNLFPIRDK